MERETLKKLACYSPSLPHVLCMNTVVPPTDGK